MVDVIQNPFNIIVTALGSAFLLSSLYRMSRILGILLFLAALSVMTVIPVYAYLHVLDLGSAMDIFTAGFPPPFSINLRYGLMEGAVICSVNIMALLGGIFLFDRLSKSPLGMTLYLIVIMGIDGMIMTRDMFNLFVFMEITSIGMYGLLGMRNGIRSTAAGFRYMVAGSLASMFLIIGTIFLYHITGTLNIDTMIKSKHLITGPFAAIAMAFLAGSILVELKPYPANGWGIDIYQTAPDGIAALIAAGVSSGMLFALYKILPLLNMQYIEIILWIGGITFIASNVVGLRQENVKRLLGFSSIAQTGLILIALSLLVITGSPGLIPYVAGGLFLNHLLAKAGLFLVTGLVEKESFREWRGLSKQKLLVFSFALLLFALVGLPPFPGFWAKWKLIMHVAGKGMYLWMGIILAGSLLEAVYLLRVLGYALDISDKEPEVNRSTLRLVPVLLTTLLTIAAGGWMGYYGYGSGILPYLLPVVFAAGLFLIDWLPGRIKGLVSLAVTGYAGFYLSTGLSGIPRIFTVILLGSGTVFLIATLYRNEKRYGFYPMLTMLILSIGGLLAAGSTLQFFASWEMMALSSFVLVSRGEKSRKASLSYIVFSIGSAFCILSGFALAHAELGDSSISALGNLSVMKSAVVLFLTAGFLVKAGAYSLHVWIPGAYSESEDDFSAIISALISKLPVFGLFLVGATAGYGLIGGVDVSLIIGWAGVLTALFGALIALFQEDVKMLLAYSSMGQVGYIITGIAAASHLGWMTAIYLSINHILYKGLIFLAIAAVISRVRTRNMYEMGGLIKKMPVAFISVLVGIIAMSGVPPLAGFGGKWLLYTTLIEKGWYFPMAVAFFSSAIAFLYMFRLIHTVFLGPVKEKHLKVKEGSIFLVIPQVLLILGIMVFSTYPRPFMEAISNILAPYYGATITWSGNTAITSLGYWNPLLIMIIIGAIFAVLLLMLLLTRQKVQPVKQFNIVFAAERPDRPETTHYAYNFFAHYNKALGWLIRPYATSFWNGVAEWFNTAGEVLRSVYTGKVQTYALYIIIFVIIIYIAAGVF